jgi:hypothetical protein
MFRTATFTRALIAALAILIGAAYDGLAQQATITSTPGQATITSNPYSAYGAGSANGYPGYNYWYYPELTGAAEVIRAQGQIMVNQQEAYKLREQVRSARIDNRRKELEQFLWEREKMPTPQDEHERQVEENTRRAKFGPDPTEIWSGYAMNILLSDLRRSPPAREDAGAPPLGDDVLGKINVTTGKGNVGVLKGGKVGFPLLLKRPDFEKERERLNYLADKAVQQAGQGDIKAEVIEEMARTVGLLKDKLAGMAREAGDAATWTPATYSESKNFLALFDDAVQALQQQGVADHLSGKYTLKGKNVAEVVRFMNEKGLLFAPATEGSQAAYNAMYYALNKYGEQAGSKPRERR